MRLWAADPHEFGAGKVHVVDPENEAKTYCGRFTAAIPGKPTTVGKATCKTCLQAPHHREERRQRSADWERQRIEAERQREASDRAWWQQYDAYLKSPQWVDRRRKVFARANGQCEACRENRATQVHHLTYRHVFNEPLFELVAICEPCHEQITDADRQAEDLG